MIQAGVFTTVILWEWQPAVDERISHAHSSFCGIFNLHKYLHNEC